MTWETDIKFKAKQIQIVAGPNGSGKSTFAESYFLRTQRSLVFLNPDLIAAGIGPLDFERASFQAGRVLIGEIKSRIARGENFSFESTLSGKSWVPILRQAADQGYRVSIYFLFLSSIEKSLKRIAKRVQQGGHSVPKSAVRRRYPRCFENFWNLYRPLAEDWYVFDNSNKAPKLILTKDEFEDFERDEQDSWSHWFLKGRKQ